MKLITLVLALVVLAVAYASDLTENDVLRFYANDIDGVVVTCPPLVRQGFGENIICVESFGSSELSRMEAETFVRRYSDLQWANAWERDEVGPWIWYHRFMIMEPNRTFAFTTWENEPYRSMSFFYELGLDRD